MISRLPVAGAWQFLLVTVLIVASACSSGPSAPSAPTEDPPSLTCPASRTEVSATAAPLAVPYGTPTLTGGTRPVNMSCSPENGATFPIGTTTVNCTATDARQRTASCTLTVTVEARAPIALTRFVAFGDSVTWGEDGTLATTGLQGRLAPLPVQLAIANYPNVLRAALQGRYPLQAGAIAVDNKGSRGEFASDSTTVQRFSSDVLRGGYQSVLILEGSNDVNQAIKDSLVRTAALANLQTMVRMAKSAGLRPYLATIPPMSPGSPRGVGAALVPGFNDALRSIAAGEGVALVDVYQSFNGDLSLLSGDGLHPNVAGYQRIADTFLEALIATLEQK